MKTNWVNVIHYKTIYKYGIKEMLKKFISELFELKIELLSDNRPEQLEEELADIWNMYDKLVLAGYVFSFVEANDINEMISTSLFALSENLTTIDISPMVFIENLIIDKQLCKYSVLRFKKEKMKRTKRRMFWSCF